ncbi:hypothetical protein Hanom_Chr05g00450051 [Helianthus anomalus]
MGRVWLDDLSVLIVRADLFDMNTDVSGFINSIHSIHQPNTISIILSSSFETICSYLLSSNRLLESQNS